MKESESEEERGKESKRPKKRMTMCEEDASRMGSKIVCEGERESGGG